VDSFYYLSTDNKIEIIPCDTMVIHTMTMQLADSRLPSDVEISKKSASQPPYRERQG